MNPFAAWENFYVIVGSAAAALIGIQFVIITLVTDMPARPSADSINAFGTPTVLHFASTLFISAILSIPWNSLMPASILLEACGFSGFAYGFLVFRRGHRQQYYKPVWDDWLWYAIAPSSFYAVLAMSALMLRSGSTHALFGMGTAALGLLLIGIRNAWDSITHIVIHHSHNDSKKEE